MRVWDTFSVWNSQEAQRSLPQYSLKEYFNIVRANSQKSYSLLPLSLHQDLITYHFPRLRKYLRGQIGSISYKHISGALSRFTQRKRVQVVA